MNDKRECGYLREYVSLLENELDACEGEILDESEQVLEDGSPEWYRQHITREAEWKLRKKQERKPKATTAPKVPKPKSTLPSTKVDHGTAPTAPAGTDQEYFWSEPKSPKSTQASKSSKGGL